jgi:hypothetical protein
MRLIPQIVKSGLVGYDAVTRNRCAAVLAFSCVVPSVCAETITFYDGDLGSLPGAQRFTYLTNPIFGSAATQTLVPGGVILDSTPERSDQAGYFGGTAGAPKLDPSDGFAIDFQVRVTSETHVSPDRAGFSVIALDHASRGIELAWAQHDGQFDPQMLFTHGEGVAVGTHMMSEYRLEVRGLSYTLSVNGSQRLSGPTRDYSSFGLPYSLSNFLFLGDDARSASAEIELRSVSITASLGPLLSGDFNHNSILDAADIDLLSTAVRSQSANLMFDLNLDGSVNQADREFWVQSRVGTYFGDADLDGEVQFADFLLLADGFGHVGGWSSGDFDGDGEVRFQDFLILSNNFGSTSLAVIPEPPSLWLVCCVVVLAWRRHSRTVADRSADRSATTDGAVGDFRSCAMRLIPRLATSGLE